MRTQYFIFPQFGLILYFECNAVDYFMLISMIGNLITYSMENGNKVLLIKFVSEALLVFIRIVSWFVHICSINDDLKDTASWKMFILFLRIQNGFIE